MGVIPGGRPRAPALRARSARGLRPARCVIAPSARTPRSGLRAPRAKTHRAPKEATSTAAARPQSQRPGQTRRRAGDRAALRGQTHAQPPRKISREPYARPTCAALTHRDKEKAAGNVSREIPRSSCACTPSVPKLPSPAARHVVRHSRLRKRPPRRRCARPLHTPKVSVAFPPWPPPMKNKAGHPRTRPPPPSEDEKKRRRRASTERWHNKKFGRDRYPKRGRQPLDPLNENAVAKSRPARPRRNGTTPTATKSPRPTKTATHEPTGKTPATKSSQSATP